MTRLLASALVLCAASSCAQDPSVTDKAQQFVQLLAADKFGDTLPLMDETMKRAMPPEKFRTVWASLVTQSGAFVQISSACVEQQSGYRIVHVACTFEKANLELRVVYDRQDLVSGFFIAPGAPDAKPLDPPYADRAAFTEEETVVVSGEIRLPGTLTIPKAGGPTPIVVFVHGSGPNDRDETLGPNKVFRDLAWGLATRGVASLRYEKRTRAFPQKMNMATATFREETVDDAIAAVTLVASDARFDVRRVAVLGHSFGGTLGPLIAKEAHGTKGVILMAGSTERLVPAILRQTEYILRADGTLSDAEQAQLDAMRRAAADLAAGKPATGVFAGVSKHYLDALDAYDGPAIAKSLAVPVFVAQGARDYQVLPDGSFAEWKAALAGHTNATFKLYPALDHLFMPGTGPSTPGDYQKPRNVSEDFVNDVAEWVKRLAS